MPKAKQGSMPSAAGRKSEQAVLSRRLKPIYDAIDSGQNKKAIQEADKVLKKHPATAGARALKALALIRSERAAEAAPIINALEEEVRAGEFDENLLQAICHCYKENYEPERIVALYEYAVAATKPTAVNDDESSVMEQLLTYLFMAYVRVRNYKHQQRIGTQLYKEHPTVPHYMWTVMSVVMQALTSEAKLANDVYYPLAEKMLEKIRKERDFKEAEEADLNLAVLEARGKWSDAIEFLHRSEGTGAVVGTREKHRLDYLYQKAGRHKEVLGRALCALEDEPNDWTNWTLLFDSAFAIIAEAEKEEMGKEKVDDSGKPEADKSADGKEVTTRRKTISHLVEVCLRASSQASGELVSADGEGANSGLGRVALIARLELMTRLQRLEATDEERSYVSERLGPPLWLISMLVDFHHRKPFCYYDVEPHLHLLLHHKGGDAPGVSSNSSNNSATDIMVRDRFLSHVRRIPGDSPWLAVLRERIELAMGGDMKKEDATTTPSSPSVLEDAALNKKLAAMWDTVKKLGEGADDGTGVAMALTILHWMWRRSASSGPDALYSLLVDSILLLEQTLEVCRLRTDALSPTSSLLSRSEHSNVPMLLLTCFYRELGALEAVTQLCQRLDIKYIQCDTLGYLQFGAAHRYGRFKAAVLYYTSQSTLYDHCDRDISECIVGAYKSGQFSQIPKLVDTAERCANSMFSVGADVMNRWLSAAFAIDDPRVAAETLAGDGEDIDWTKVRDNRDFEPILPLEAAFCPLGQSLAEWRRIAAERRAATLQSFIEELKLRHYTCHVVGLIGLAATTDHWQKDPTGTTKKFQGAVAGLVKSIEAVNRNHAADNQLTSTNYDENGNRSCLHSFAISLATASNPTRHPILNAHYKQLVNSSVKSPLLLSTLQLAERILADAYPGCKTAGDGGGEISKSDDLSVVRLGEQLATSLSIKAASSLPRKRLPAGGKPQDPSGSPDKLNNESEILHRIEWCARSLESLALCSLTLAYLEMLQQRGHHPANNATPTSKSAALDNGGPTKGEKLFHQVAEQRATLRTELADVQAVLVQLKEALKKNATPSTDPTTSLLSTTSLRYSIFKEVGFDAVKKSMCSTLATSWIQSVNEMLLAVERLEQQTVVKNR